MIDLEVSPGAQADAAAEEQLVDGHLTVPGGLEWDETPVERHTIANLRYAGGKEHDVRYVSEVHLDAALAREAEVGRLYDSLVNRSNRERDASYKRESALREELPRYKNLFGQAQKAIDRLNELHPKRMGELAKRLTVAEQLLKRFDSMFSGGICSGPLQDLVVDVRAALKPAAEQTKICPNCKVCMGSPDFPENCLINGVKP